MAKFKISAVKKIGRAFFIAQFFCLTGIFPMSAQNSRLGADLDRPDFGGNGDRTAAKADRGRARLDDRRPGPAAGDEDVEKRDTINQDWSSQLDSKREKDKESDQMEQSDKQDTYFGRQSYVDLLIDDGSLKTTGLTGDDFGSASMRDPDSKDPDGRDPDRTDRAADHGEVSTDRLLKNFSERSVGKSPDRYDSAGAQRRHDYEELLEVYAPPPPVGPNNWVPDKLDPIQTGAFSTSPDNGSPVPYRLNGHVDLERTFPWLHDH